MSDTNILARIKRGEIRGIQNAQEVIAASIHRKPWLTFTLPGQIFTRIAEDGEEEYVPNPEAYDMASLTIYDVEKEFRFRVDPKKLRPSHSSRLSAIQNNIGTATGMTDKVLAAQSGTGKRNDAQKVKKSDLPEVELLTELYDDLDDALNVRLLDCVMRDSNGSAIWDYQDESGRTPELTKRFLEENVDVAEAMQESFTRFLSRSPKSAVADTPTKTETGTGEATPAIPQVSSVESPSNSSLNGRTEQTADSDTYRNGMNH